MQNGVLLMGGSSLVALVYTRGDITTLVTLYAINVFVTFSLSQLAMCRFWWRERLARKDWQRQVLIHVVGLVLCLGILVVNVYEKFWDGAWVTIVVTGAVVALFFWTRGHYRKVQQSLRRLDDILPVMPKASAPARALDPTKPTAVLLVGSYAGLGQSGTGVLRVDGKDVATQTMEHTIPFILAWDENLDVGSDTGTPVDDRDCQVPFAFTGKIGRITLTIDRPQLSPEDMKKLETAQRNNKTSE